jgi:hypothetical protein
MILYTEKEIFMSMEHKAYMFDWKLFEVELLPILLYALKANKKDELIQFIKNNQQQLSDPNCEEQLRLDWQLSRNLNIEELGDIAITKYYSIAINYGLGMSWIDILDTIPKEAKNALLGETIKANNLLFDPGKMGSYFQRPETILQSLILLANISNLQNTRFIKLLQYCKIENLGAYITF